MPRGVGWGSGDKDASFSGRVQTDPGALIFGSDSDNASRT